jgi:predicted ester cyclase
MVSGVLWYPISGGSLPLSQIAPRFRFGVEGEDRVAWQRTFRGTHKGKFKGFPASGLNIVWRDMVTSHFYNERIGEEWVITDLAEQLLVSSKQNHK